MALQRLIVHALRDLVAVGYVLLVIAGFVLVAGLLGMLTALLATLNERRREMAVLRAVGAHPYHILLLFMLETLFIVGIGCLAGVIVLYLLLVLGQPLLVEAYGVNIAITAPDIQQLGLIAVVVILGVLVSIIPGLIAYRRSLQDGLAIRV